jgi:hypothetical protein
MLILASMLVFAVIITAGFAQEKGEPFYPEDPHLTRGKHLLAQSRAVQHMSPGMRGENIGILGQLAGIDDIHRKYQFEIQRVFLDAKQEALNFHEEQQNLKEKLFDLIEVYEENSIKNRREIVEILEQLSDNQKKIQAIQEKSMEMIEGLHQEQKKEMEKALEEEINRLSTDEEEMNKFVEMIRRRWPFDFTSHQGPGRKM